MLDLIYKGDPIKLWDGQCKKYTANLNLKAFYNELHDLLVDKSFTDRNFIGIPLKKGEFLNNDDLTRNQDYFEKKFVVINKGDSKEIEITWEAHTNKVPFTSHTVIEFTFAIECRNWQVKEVLDGNQKKTFDTGTWELRNKLYYNNFIVKNYLKTIPFVKNSENLQKLYLKYIHMPKVKAELEKHVKPKVIKPIADLIEKYFVAK